jgi:uncharacterized protein (TIGR03435 family)
MKRTMVGSGLFVFASCAALAQTTAAPLSFEVASLKPAAPPTDGRIMRRMAGGPGSPDPGQLTYTNVTVKMLLTTAYNLKEYQVEGPDWIDSLGYDMVAKLPPGATQVQVAQMLQTLLAERFKIAFHHETRQLPVYALVVAKGGPKMMKVEMLAAADGSPAAPGAGRGDSPRGYDGAAPTGGGGGAALRTANGPGIRMMMSPGGVHMVGYMTMEQLANQLTRQMDRPVLDQTELTATFDVDITWMPDEMDRGNSRMAQMAAISGAVPRSGGDSPHNADEPAMTLPQALQEKLGLKLDTRKSAAEILIVDRADKVPVEN